MKSTGNTPSITTELVETIEAEQKEGTFKDVGFSEDTTVSVKKGMTGIFEACKAGYTIEDKKYTGGGRKGKLDVHYPVLSGSERDFTKVNQAIYDKLIADLDVFPEDEELTTDIDMSYEVKTATDKLISIQFSGFYNPKDVAHPTYTSFDVNYDLEQGKLLELKDVVVFGDNALEKVHSAMKEQVEECVEAFERYKIEVIQRQIEEQAEFYIKEKQVYIRFSITAGASYHTYVGFECIA